MWVALPISFSCARSLMFGSFSSPFPLLFCRRHHLLHGAMRTGFAGSDLTPLASTLRGLLRPQLSALPLPAALSNSRTVAFSFVMAALLASASRSWPEIIEPSLDKTIVSRLLLSFSGAFCPSLPCQFFSSSSLRHGRLTWRAHNTFWGTPQSARCSSVFAVFHGIPARSPGEMKPCEPTIFPLLPLQSDFPTPAAPRERTFPSCSNTLPRFLCFFRPFFFPF